MRIDICALTVCAILAAPLTDLRASEALGDSGPQGKNHRPHGTVPASKSQQLPPKTAHWIWADTRRNQLLTAVFSKEFEVDQEASTAELRAVADFNHLTVSLNGRPVAEVADYGPMARVDVTQHLRRGNNRLSVRSESSAGPAAIAVRLDVTLKDGTRRSIVSDSTWQAFLANDVDSNDRDHKPIHAGDAVSFGKLADEPWGNFMRPVGINEVDDYTQWKQALGSDVGTDPSTFVVPEGYQIELLRSAGKDVGSWISMAFDPKGRLVIAREDKGLLRLALPKTKHKPIELETINDSLLECRGLLFAFGSLYVNANNSKGFYRLRDTNGDDRYDEVKLLYRSTGSVGHGRNDLALGPDNMIYLIHGDAVDLPKRFADKTSPFREHRRGIKTREGHVIRTDRDGTRWELLTSGLRNPFGIDFNTDGEMFTYDADAEHDMGAPWYRPTRVNHLVIGGDFGWRGVTGSWPPYYPDHPDNAIANIDIGKGSPTAVKFGTRSSFPPKYRKALFILDWAYGRIIAIHMTPRGASYACRGETFIKGRPLNVTDLAFGPDGAMYFVTGGRKTQSGLYRVSYTGPPVEDVAETRQQRERIRQAAQARALRRQLESYHGQQGPDILDAAWTHLDSVDPWIRHAARIAIEHQPIESWKQRALAESRLTAALTALMALARSGEASVMPAVLERLREFSLKQLNISQKLIALHTYSLCTRSQGKRERALLSTAADHLDPFYPDRSIMTQGAAHVNRALSQLLSQLEAPSFVPKTLALLDETTDQKQQLQFLFALRAAKKGWTLGLREAYFKALQQSRYFQGGEGMPKFIEQIHRDAVASLSDAERVQLKDVLAEMESETTEGQTVAMNRPVVREWTIADLETVVNEASKNRDIKHGQEVFRAALCNQCHRMGNEGRPIGPDLTSVSRRFSRRDILAAIISPSQVVAEQYRSDMIVTTAGKVITGRIVLHSDFRSPELLIAANPLQPWTVTKISKDQIESHTKTQLSTMPKGLLNTLTKEDILDLLAFLEVAGMSDTVHTPIER